MKAKEVIQMQGTLLARDIFVRSVSDPLSEGDPETLARKAITAAEVFYRVQNEHSYVKGKKK